MHQATDGALVIGTGRVSLPPDLLVVRFAAEVTAPGVVEALDRCSRAMAAMTSALRDAGTADSDRLTAGASVYQSHDHQGRPRGWAASQELLVRLRDLAGAGELINATVASAGDAARLRSVSFDIDRTGERYRQARTEARRRAFADARASAQQYAELAGRRLGVVISVREGDGGYPPPIPMRAAGFAATESADRTAALSAAVPAEAGELDVTITVEVRWELVS